MLVVVDDVRNKHCEDVQLLDLLLKVANGHDVVHCLEGINDMQLVVVWVLLEVTDADFFCKVVKSFLLDVVNLTEFILLENFVDHVGETVISHDTREVEDIKVNFIKVLNCLFKMVDSNF